MTRFWDFKLTGAPPLLSCVVRRRRDAMGVRRFCPRCDSADVQRLPENGIAPHPGYECKGCGLAMRPNGSGLAFGAMLALALAMCVGTTLPWFGIPADVERLPLGLPVAAGGVALYCFYQLLRPAPRLAEDSAESV